MMTYWIAIFVALSISIVFSLVYWWVFLMSTDDKPCLTACRQELHMPVIETKPHSDFIHIENRFIATDQLHLQYEGGNVIPRFAALPDGSPFTGRAYGTVENADWRATFKDGLPHGECRIVWNDIAVCTLMFENGVYASETKNKSQGSDGNA